MARYNQRPENALKRANEFIEVGKPARALDTLQEVFRNKKWAYNWSESVLEPIMFKYLDLCVELKKSHIAKEGLFQYRNMFQSVNVGSLENVIRGYLRMAEEKTENAREQSAQAVVDIDDLDNLATPESILLSAVSGEDAQDRSDRTILTPWVKFLWESYCQCLELLRTNAHVETLYHDIARMAFQFCLKYNRKTEFRKLCDKLRKHLEDICKLPTQVANVSISKPETQQLNLDTRLYQLDSAIQMELWQEAYKAIEDIHGLMNLSKKMPVPKTMANYYQKLAMVFWKAGNYLFHAAALFKLFQLSKEMKKNITPEELQRMACRVLLATLSIPLPSAHPEFDRFIETDKSPLEKAQRLAVLLGLLQPPTRASLLKDIVRVNVVSLASPQLQDLYNWLEVEFHPLLLCPRVQTVIEALQTEENSPLQQYVPALQDVTLVRLVRQVAQVYQTIEFSRLIQLAKFTTPFHMERLLVDCVRHNDMQIRIDHGKQCIHFGMDLSESQREDKPEGPTLQIMPSEQIRNQLVNMATILHQASNIINPTKKKTERGNLRTVMVNNYHETKVREHQRILQRHKIIEDRKEYIERLNTVREEEELRRQEELQRQQMIAEQKRLDQEREERERKRQLNEIQQIKDRHLKEKMQQISQTSHGQKILKKLDEDEIKKMDADQIAAREAEELQKERRELQAKLKSQEKKVDYLERAKRLEEIPMLQESMKERQQQDQAFWEQQESERIALAIEERKLAVANRERLKRMKPDKDSFLDKLNSERNIVYEDKIREFERHIAEERRKRLAERKAQRKEERRIKWMREKEEEAERKREEERRREEEERRLIEETAKKEREEQERLAKEAQERKNKEHMEMMERVAAKQRQKEEEVERRLMEEREATRDREPASSWRRGDPGRDRDRGDRERARGDREPAAVSKDRERPTDKEEEPQVPPPASSWRRDKPTPAAAPVAAAPEPDRERTEREAPKKPEVWRVGARDRDGDREKRPDPVKPTESTGAWRRADRDPERVERGMDRSERGIDRPERGLDRPERGMDRSERGMDRSERGGMERTERGGMERSERGGMERSERGGGFGRSDRGGFDRDRGDRDRGGFERGGFDRDRGGFGRSDRDRDGGEERRRGGDRDDRDRRDFGRDRDRDDKDRYGEDRRGGDRDGGSWRSKGADDDGPPRRGPPPSRGSKDGSDWRTAKETRRAADDAPPRRDEIRRGGPPLPSKPREEKPREASAPTGEGEDGTWQVANRRR